MFDSFTKNAHGITLRPSLLIKEELTKLLEQTFNREGSLYFLACNENPAFFTCEQKKNNISCGRVRKYVMLTIIFWTIYL